MAHKFDNPNKKATDPPSGSSVGIFRLTQTDDHLISFFKKINKNEESISKLSQINKIQKKQMEVEPLNDFYSHISHYDMINNINVSDDISPDSTGKNTLLQFDYIIPSSYNSVFYKDTDISAALSYIEKVKFEYECQLELDIKFMKYMGIVGGYLVIYGACLFSGTSILKMILGMNLGDFNYKKKIITSLLKIAQWTNISSTTKNVLNMNNTIQTIINKVEESVDDKGLLDILITKESNESMLHERIKEVFYQINNITGDSSNLNVPSSLIDVFNLILSQSSNIYVYISILQSEWNFLNSTSNIDRFKSTLTNILFNKSPYIHIIKRGNNCVSQILKLTNLNNNIFINQITSFVFNNLQNNLAINNSFNKFIINTLTEKIFPENLVKDQFFDSEDKDKDARNMNKFNAQKLRSYGYNDKQVSEEFIKFIDEQVNGKKDENKHVYNITELMNLVKVGFPLFFSIEYFNVMYHNNNNLLFGNINNKKTSYERANIFIFYVYDSMISLCGGSNVLKLYIYKNFLLTFRNALITTYHKIKNILVKLNKYFSDNSETYNMFIKWLDTELIYNISISSIVSAFSDFFFNQGISNTFENLRQLLMITPLDSKNIVPIFVENLNILRYSFNEKNLTKSLNLIFNDPTQFCYVNLVYAILFGNAPHTIWSKFPLLRENFYKLNYEKDEDLLGLTIMNNNNNKKYKLEKLGDMSVLNNKSKIDVFKNQQNKDYLPKTIKIPLEYHKVLYENQNENIYSHNVLLAKNDSMTKSHYIFTNRDDFQSIQISGNITKVNEYSQKIKEYFYNKLNEDISIQAYKKNYDDCVNDPLKKHLCDTLKKKLNDAYKKLPLDQPIDFREFNNGEFNNSPIAIIKNSDGQNIILNHIEYFIALNKFLKTESLLKDKNIKIKFNTDKFENIDVFFKYITNPDITTKFQNIHGDEFKLGESPKDDSDDYFMILRDPHDSANKLKLTIEDLWSKYYNFTTKKFDFELNTDMNVEGLLLNNMYNGQNIITIKNDISSNIIKQLQLSNIFLKDLTRPDPSMICLLELYKIIDSVEKDKINPKYDNCITNIFNIPDNIIKKDKLLILNNISNRQSFKDLMIKNQNFKSDYYNLLNNYDELFKEQMNPQLKNSLRNNDISLNSSQSRIIQNFNNDNMNNINFDNLNIPLLNNIIYDKKDDKLIQYQKRTLYDLVLLANNYKINNLSLNEIINKIVIEQGNETLNDINAENIINNFNLIKEINKEKKFLKFELSKDIDNLIQIIEKSKSEQTLNSNKEINNKINNLLFRIKLAFNEQRDTLLSQYNLENITKNTDIKYLIDFIEKENISNDDLTKLHTDYSIEIPEELKLDDNTKTQNNNKLIDLIKCDIYDTIECLLINDKNLIQKCIINKKWEKLKNNTKKMDKSDNYCLKYKGLLCEDNLGIPEELSINYSPTLNLELNNKFGITSKEITNNGEIFEELSDFKISNYEASIKEINEIYNKIKKNEKHDNTIVISSDNYIVQGHNYFFAMQKIDLEHKLEYVNKGHNLPHEQKKLREKLSLKNKDIKIIQINEKANDVLPLLAYLDKKININDTFITNVLPITKGQEQINVDIYKFIDKIFKDNNNVFRLKETIENEIIELKNKKKLVPDNEKIAIQIEIDDKEKEIKKLESLSGTKKDKKDKDEKVDLLEKFTIDKSFEFFCEKNEDLFKTFLTSAIHNYDNYDENICQTKKPDNTILTRNSFLKKYLDESVKSINLDLICKKQLSTYVPKDNIDFETYFKSYFISHYISYIKNSIVFAKDDAEYKNGEKQNISILKMLDVMQMLSNYKPDEIFKSCIEFNRKLIDKSFAPHLNKFTDYHKELKEEIIDKLLPELTSNTLLDTSDDKKVLNDIYKFYYTQNNNYSDVNDKFNIITAYITELYKIIDYYERDDAISGVLDFNDDNENKIKNNLHKLIGETEDNLKFLHEHSGLNPLQIQQNKVLVSEIKLCIQNIQELFKIKITKQSKDLKEITIYELEQKFKTKDDEKKVYAHPHEFLKLFLKLDGLLYGELVDDNKLNKLFGAIKDDELGIRSSNIETNLSLSMLINNVDIFDNFIKYIKNIENNVDVINTRKINMKKYVRQVIDDAHKEVVDVASRTLPFNISIPTFKLPSFNQQQVMSPFLKNTYDVSLQEHQSANSQMTDMTNQLSLHQTNMNLQSNLNKITQKQTNVQQNIQTHKQTAAQANKQTLKSLLKFGADDDADTQISSLWGEVPTNNEGLDDEQDGVLKVVDKYETHSGDFDFDPEGIIDCNKEDMYFFEGNPGYFRSTTGNTLNQSNAYIKKCFGDWKFGKYFKDNVIYGQEHLIKISNHTMYSILNELCKVLGKIPVPFAKGAELACRATIASIFKDMPSVPTTDNTFGTAKILGLISKFNLIVTPFLKSQNDLYENYIEKMNHLKGEFDKNATCPDVIDEHDMNGVQNLCPGQLKSYALMQFMCRQNILSNAPELEKTFGFYKLFIIALNTMSDILKFLQIDLGTYPQIDINDNLFTRLKDTKAHCDTYVNLYTENMPIKDGKLDINFIQNLIKDVITKPEVKTSFIRILYCLLKENREVYETTIANSGGAKWLGMEYLFQNEQKILDDYMTKKNIVLDCNKPIVNTNTPIVEYDVSEGNLLIDLVTSVYDKMVDINIFTIVNPYNSQSAVLLTNSLYSSMISDKNGDWDIMLKNSESIRNIFFGNPKYSRVAKAYELSSKLTTISKNTKYKANAGDIAKSEHIHFNFFQQFLLYFNDIKIDKQNSKYIEKKLDTIQKISNKIKDIKNDYDSHHLNAFKMLNDIAPRVDCSQSKLDFYDKFINELENEKKQVIKTTLSRSHPPKVSINPPTQDDDIPIRKMPDTPENKDFTKMEPDELDELKRSLEIFKNDFYDYTCYEALENDLKDLQLKLELILNDETNDRTKKLQIIQLHSKYLIDIYDVIDINSIETKNSNIFKDLDLTPFIKNKDFKKTFIDNLYTHIRCDEQIQNNNEFNQIFKYKPSSQTLEDFIKTIENNNCNFKQKDMKYTIALNILTNMFIPKFRSEQYIFNPSIPYKDFTLHDNKIFVESLYKLYIKNQNQLSYINNLTEKEEESFLKKNINGTIIEIPFEKLIPNDPNTSLITLWILQNFDKLNITDYSTTRDKILSDNITIENFFTSVKKLSLNLRGITTIITGLLQDENIIKLFKEECDERLKDHNSKDFYICLQKELLNNSNIDVLDLRNICNTTKDAELNKEFNELLIFIASKQFLETYIKYCNPDNSNKLVEFDFNLVIDEWDTFDKWAPFKKHSNDQLCSTKIWHSLNVIFMGYQNVPFLTANTTMPKPQNPNFLFSNILNENYNDRDISKSDINDSIFKEKAFIDQQHKKINLKTSILMDKSHIIYKHIIKIFSKLHKNLDNIHVKMSYYFDYMNQPLMNKVTEWFSRTTNWENDPEKFHKFIKDTELELTGLIIRNTYEYFLQNVGTCDMNDLRQKIITSYYGEKVKDNEQTAFIDMFLIGPYEDYYENKIIKKEFYDDNSNLAIMLNTIGVNCKDLAKINWADQTKNIDNIFNKEQTFWQKFVTNDKHLIALLDKLIGTHNLKDLYTNIKGVPFFKGLHEKGIIYNLYTHMNDLRIQEYQLNFYKNTDGSRTDIIDLRTYPSDNISIKDRTPDTFYPIYSDIDDKIDKKNTNLHKINMNLKFGLIYHTLDIIKNNKPIPNSKADPNYNEEIKLLIQNMQKSDNNIIDKNIKIPLFENIRTRLNECRKDPGKKEFIDLLCKSSRKQDKQISINDELTFQDVELLMQHPFRIQSLNAVCIDYISNDMVFDIEKNYKFFKNEILIQFFINNPGFFTKLYGDFLDRTYDNDIEIKSCLMGMNKPNDYQYMLKDVNNILSELTKLQNTEPKESICKNKYGFYYTYLMEHIHLFVCLTKLKLSDSTENSVSDIIIKEYFNQKPDIPNLYDIFDKDPAAFMQYKATQESLVKSEFTGVPMDLILQPDNTYVDDMTKKGIVNFMHKYFNELYSIFSKENKELLRLEANITPKLINEEEEKKKKIKQEERTKRLNNLIQVLNRAELNDNESRANKMNHLIPQEKKNAYQIDNLCFNEIKFEKFAEYDIIQKFKTFNKIFNTLKNDDDIFTDTVIDLIPNEKTPYIQFIKDQIAHLSEIMRSNDDVYEEIYTQIEKFNLKCINLDQEIEIQEVKDIEEFEDVNSPEKEELNKLIIKQKEQNKCDQSEDINLINNNIKQINDDIVQVNTIKAQIDVELLKLKDDDASGISDDENEKYISILETIESLRNNFLSQLNTCIKQKRKAITSLLKHIDKEENKVYDVNNNSKFKLEKILYKLNIPPIVIKELDYITPINNLKKKWVDETVNSIILDLKNNSRQTPFWPLIHTRNQNKIEISLSPNFLEESYDWNENRQSHIYKSLCIALPFYYNKYHKHMLETEVLHEVINLHADKICLNQIFKETIKELNEKYKTKSINVTPINIYEDISDTIKTKISPHITNTFDKIIFKNSDFKLIDILKQKEGGLVFNKEGDYVNLFDYNRFRNVIINIDNLDKINKDNLKKIREGETSQIEFKKHEFTSILLKQLVDGNLIKTLDQYIELFGIKDPTIVEIIGQIKKLIETPNHINIIELREKLTKLQMRIINLYDNQLYDVTHKYGIYQNHGDFKSNLDENQKGINTFMSPFNEINALQNDTIDLSKLFKGGNEMYKFDNTQNIGKVLNLQKIEFQEEIKIKDINQKNQSVNLFKFLDINLNLNIQEKVLKILNINRGPIPLNNKTADDSEKSVFFPGQKFSDKDNNIYNAMTKIIEDYIKNPDNLYKLFSIKPDGTVIFQLKKDNFNLTQFEFEALRNHFKKNNNIYNTNIDDLPIDTITINFKHFNSFIKNNVADTFYTILQELNSMLYIPTKKIESNPDWETIANKITDEEQFSNLYLDDPTPNDLGNREATAQIKDKAILNLLKKIIDIPDKNPIDINLLMKMNEFMKQREEEARINEEVQRKLRLAKRKGNSNPPQPGGGLFDNISNTEQLSTNEQVVDKINWSLLNEPENTNYIQIIQKIFTDSENRNFEKTDINFEDNIDNEKPLFMISITHIDITNQFTKREYKSIELNSQILDIGQITSLKDISQIDDKDSIKDKMFDSMKKYEEDRKTTNPQKYFFLPKNYKLKADNNENSLDEGLYVKFTTNDDIKKEKTLKILDNKALLEIFQTNNFNLEQLSNLALIYLKQKNIKKQFYFGSYSCALRNDIEAIINSNYNNHVFCGITWSLFMRNLDIISFIPFDNHQTKMPINKTLDKLFVDVRFEKNIKEGELCELDTRQNNFIIPYFIITQFQEYLFKNLIYQEVFRKINDIQKYLSIMHFMFNNYKFKNIMVKNLDFRKSLLHNISNNIESLNDKSYIITETKGFIFFKVSNIDITEQQFSLENWIKFTTSSSTDERDILHTLPILLKGYSVFKTEDIVLQSQIKSALNKYNIISMMTVIQKLKIQLDKYINEDNEIVVKDNTLSKYKNIQFFYTYLFEYIMLIQHNLNITINSYNFEIMKIIKNINKLSDSEIYKKDTKESYIHLISIEQQTINEIEQSLSHDQIIINTWAEYIFLDDILLEEHNDCDLLQMIDIIENKKNYNQKLSSIILNYSELIKSNKLYYISEVRKLKQNFINENVINKYYELKQLQLYDLEINLRKLKELQTYISTNIIQKVETLKLYKEHSEELASINQTIYYPGLLEYLLTEFHPKFKTIVINSNDLNKKIANLETIELTKLNQVYKKHYQKYILNIVKNKTHYEMIDKNM